MGAAYAMYGIDVRFDFCCGWDTAARQVFRELPAEGRGGVVAGRRKHMAGGRWRSRNEEVANE